MQKKFDPRDLKQQTVALHADRDLEPLQGIAPPIAQSVTYYADSDQEFAENASAPLFDSFYGRHGNPTSSRVAKVLAELEGGEEAIIFSSGMGAITPTVLAFVQAGDHVVAQNRHYMGTTNLMTKLLPRFGVDVTQVDQRSTDEFQKAMRPNTKVVMTESPVNPTMHLTDLAAVAEIARSAGAVSVCDNTFATPINQRPLNLGIDLVCHSVTKYIGGHHDLLAGATIGTTPHLEKIWDMSMTVGSVAAPFNAWLALRGLRTLSLRVAQHNQNALALAEMLIQHPAVENVLFPGLESHPQHNLARQQMDGFGGLFSFVLKDGNSAGTQFIKDLRLGQNAGSLGGVDTLVIQTAAMWGGRLSDGVLREQGVEPGMIRVATGIEDTNDLLADFQQALPSA